MSQPNSSFIMDAKNELFSIIYKKGTTLTQICKNVSAKTGDKKFTQKGISSKFSKGTIRFNEIQLMLKELGYKIEFIEDK